MEVHHIAHHAEGKCQVEVFQVAFIVIGTLVWHYNLGISKCGMSHVGPQSHTLGKATIDYSTIILSGHA